MFLNDYDTAPYFQIKCWFSSSVHNVAIVPLQRSYFYDFLHFVLPTLPYTDKNSNASALYKHLNTLSTDFVSKK